MTEERLNASGTMVKQYDPIGRSKQLQEEITNLLHNIIMNNGKFTLAEIGYLHMNTVTFVRDHAEVKIYFLPELSTTKTREFGAVKVQPSPMLKVFQNYLFVGDNLDAVTSFENVTVPKYSIVNDDLGRPAIHIKDGKKHEDDVEVLVLHCNFALTMAALNGVNLTDPNFAVDYETIAGSTKGSEVVMSIGSEKEFPIMINVRFSPNPTGYDPDQAIPFLLAKATKAKAAKSNQKKLARKVSESAESIQKKLAAKQTSKFNKFM